jgi:hypothetical protein
MDLKAVQVRLAATGLYADKVDGEYGSNTDAAVRELFKRQKVDFDNSWDEHRREIAAEQLLCKIAGIDAGKIDGYAGPQTLQAFVVYDARLKNGGQIDPAVERWRDNESETPVKNVVAAHQKWPHQRDVESFYGPVGTSMVFMDLPFPMVLAWDLKTTVHRWQCHAKCKDAFHAVWQKTLDHFGHDKIKELRLDRWGGTLNVRKMRGGSRWSMHSWGCAEDVDPDRNSLTTHKPQAVLSHPEYKDFWDIVYSEGGLSLGREKNYDWMHFQFTSDFS